MQKTTPHVAMQFEQTEKKQERWGDDVPEKPAADEEEAEANPEESLNVQRCK